MPQLNPAPWLPIFLLTWITLIFLLMKTLNSTPHPSVPLHNKSFTNYYWTWPWH